MLKLFAVIAATTGLLVGPAVMFVPSAGGQAPSRLLLAQAQPPVQAPTLNLTVEQRHVIKELVKEQHVTPASANVPLEPGAVVPESVKLNPMPELVAQKVPQVKSHLFFVKDDRIALVNAKDKTIAEVIE
jgi:hypothetical protein